MLASIIVPTYGSRLEYLKDTLISAQNQNLSADEYEIIAVDNSPNARVLPVVEEMNRNGGYHVRYVRETKMGLLDARHAGARHAKGQILVYVDDDIIAPPEWLQALTEPFKDPDVACSGGKVLPQWEAEVPSWFSQFTHGHLSLLDLGNKTIEIKHAGLWGCNMAVRRDYFFAVGGGNPEIIGGDPSFIWLMGSGECGLEDKLHDLGFKLIYEPRAWLYHRIPASRLKPEYFYWRLFMQGVDDSYTYIRDLRLHNKKYLYAYVIKGILFNHLRAGKALIKSLIKRGQRIRLKADALYWYARGQHHARTLLSKKMRQHVFKDSYL